MRQPTAWYGQNGALNISACNVAAKRGGDGDDDDDLAGLFILHIDLDLRPTPQACWRYFDIYTHSYVYLDANKYLPCPIQTDLLTLSLKLVVRVVQLKLASFWSHLKHQL